MPIENYQLTKHNIDHFLDAIDSELEKEPILMVTVKKAGTGKWTLARLWRAWMATTTEWFNEQGFQVVLKGPSGKLGEPLAVNAEDIHELFTKKWLSTDKDGVRLSWAKKPHGGMTPADEGQRLHALRCHEEWCLGKGIDISNPRDSDYRKLQDEERK